jgi:hypothetical protein
VENLKRKRKRETDDLSEEFRDNQKRQKTSNIQPPVLPILPPISTLFKDVDRRQQIQNHQLRNPYFGR